MQQSASGEKEESSITSGARKTEKGSEDTQSQNCNTNRQELAKKIFSTMPPAWKNLYNDFINFLPFFPFQLDVRVEGGIQGNNDITFTVAYEITDKQHTKNLNGGHLLKEFFMAYNSDLAVAHLSSVKLNEQILETILNKKSNGNVGWSFSSQYQLKLQKIKKTKSFNGK
jgi:hypothetical protein